MFESKQSYTDARFPLPFAIMKTDERLMFHLSEGALRRWCLWKEEEFPEWAVGEEDKYNLFQSWKKEPYKRIGDNADGEPVHVFHPMAEFTNWPYWLLIDLFRYLRLEADDAVLLLEPENFKEAVCNLCDENFSKNEESDPSQLTV